MSLTRFLVLLTLSATVLLEGCANSGSLTGTVDCRGLSGSYHDAGEPTGDSLTQFLLKNKPPVSRLMQLGVSAGSIRVSSGTTAGTLAVEKDFNCSSANRIVLTRQDSSRIQLPPLIDQVKTVTYVLTGGPGMNLVLNTQVQTTISPYGAKLAGPMQTESITTWRRTGP
ncbi:hypothetical protein [Polaromonas sp.]|uniref:hypothetical protein n=1 Tax=Polaromonas sp. TaxID=1869339 RepID=UPI00352AF21B